jgi:hypothetical protein
MKTTVDGKYKFETKNGQSNFLTARELTRNSGEIDPRKTDFPTFQKQAKTQSVANSHSKSEFQTFLTAREQPGSVGTCLNRKATFQVFKNNQRPSTWLKNYNPNPNPNPNKKKYIIRS